jgi:ABC-type dipeptide/oligopeptide/nickel transport system permease subunit
VTLGQVFGAATIAIAVVVIASFAFFVRTTRSSILQVSKKKQELVAQRVEARVVRELGRAVREPS